MHWNDWAGLATGILVIIALAYLAISVVRNSATKESDDEWARRAIEQDRADRNA